MSGRYTHCLWWVDRLISILSEKQDNLSKKRRGKETIMNQFEMKQSAYQSQLKSRALQVLIYLIDRSDKEQTCFPAVPTISRDLHISISTVKRAMRELVEAGYVEKESRFREENRGQTSNLYTLHFTEKANVSELTVEPEINMQTEKSEQTGEEAVVIAQENTDILCGEQFAGRLESESVAKQREKENTGDSDVVNRRSLLIWLKCCADNNNVGKTMGIVSVTGNKVQGHLSKDENIGITGDFFRDRQQIIFACQWPGEGVSLIPP